MREPAGSARDPLLAGTLERAVPALRTLDGDHPAAVLRLCRTALDGPPPATATGTAPAPAASAPATAAPPPVPERWTRLSALLHSDRETALGLARRIAETTSLGSVRPAAAVGEVWELAVPALLAAAVRGTDLTVLAALVRAGVFLCAPSPGGDGGPAPDRASEAAALTVRAARSLAARQRPDGGFGEPATTVDCAWALAETVAPGVTGAYSDLPGLLPGPDAQPEQPEQPERRELRHRREGRPQVHETPPRTARSAPATYGGKE